MSVTPTMVTLAEAQRIIAGHVRPLGTETVSLDDADGRILAVDVVCDLDHPPFDKAMMDGFAVRCADFSGGQARLRVVEEIAAGDVPVHVLEPGQAAPISTGAAVPQGADGVVQVERSSLSQDGQDVELHDAPEPGQHIARRGQDVVAGETVLAAGSRLGPCQAAVAAAAGVVVPRVHRRPTVAVLSTGSELVPPHVKPQGGRIRNSNGQYLVSAIRQDGIEPDSLGIVGDDEAGLRSSLEKGLEADVLITTGGASVGKHDLVPDLLAELGVTFRFCKVAIKPGKPILFGTHGDGKIVFALPGNPVSCFVGMWLMVRPALAGLQGATVRFPSFVQARTTEPLPETGARQTFRPARADASEQGELTVTPVRWQGSGDLFGLSAANGLLVRPADSPAVPAGQTVLILPLDHWNRPVG